MPADAGTKPNDLATSWTFWLLAVLLMLAAFGVRLGEHEFIVRADRVSTQDNDTLRWLAHLSARDQSAGYPLREVRDGFPEGSELHWTLPMEWLLRGLDPLVAWALPQAQRYEAAAVLAGPVLACLSLLVFLALAARLLGGLGALTAGAFYTLSNPVISVSWLGNGDHQNLQHLLLVFSVLAWLVRGEGLGSRALAWLSGAALGGAVWVSTESMVLVQLLCVVAFVQLTWLRRWLRPEHLGDELARAVALVAVLFLAQVLEQASFWNVTWDKVSWFTSHQGLVFLLFLALVQWRLPALLAAAVALAVGVVALWVIPGYAALLRDELGRFAAVNQWLQSCIDEYQSAFGYQHAFSWQAGIKRFSWLLPAFPFLWAACACDRGRSLPFRVALLVLSLGTFALAAWENKLAHLFGLVFPLVLLRGAHRLAALVERWPPAGPWPVRAAFAVGVVAAALESLPDARPPLMRSSDQGIEELCQAVAARAGGRDAGAVLAPWDLGAPLMYRASAPVVASGYHRNLAGIRDAYRLYLAQPEEESQLRELLRARRVRWVVAWYDRWSLNAAPAIAGIDRKFLERDGDQVRATPFALQSLYWRLRFGVPVPGFRQVYASQLEVELRGARPMPLFVLYEWDG